MHKTVLHRIRIFAAKFFVEGRGAVDLSSGNVWQQNVNSSDPPCKISPSVRSLPPLVWCWIRSASDNDPGRVIDPQLDFSASQCSSSAAIISPIRLIKYMLGRPDFKIMGLQGGGGGGV